MQVYKVFHDTGISVSRTKCSARDIDPTICKKCKFYKYHADACEARYECEVTEPFLVSLNRSIIMSQAENNMKKLEYIVSH